MVRVTKSLENFVLYAGLGVASKGSGFGLITIYPVTMKGKKKEKGK